MPSIINIQIGLGELAIPRELPVTSVSFVSGRQMGTGT